MPKVGYFNLSIYFLIFHPVQITSAFFPFKSGMVIHRFIFNDMRLSKKGWVILTTLVMIGLGFAFYFLVYVKNKESEIITDKMRVLTQIKANIDLLVKNEERIRRNERTGIERTLEILVKNNYLREFLRELELLKANAEENSKKINLSKEKIDLLKKEIESLQTKITALKDLKINFSSDLFIEAKENLDIEELHKDVNETLRIYYPGWSIDESFQKQNSFFRDDSVTWSVNQLVFKKPYIDFFRKELIERKDVFEFIVIALFDGERMNTLYSNHSLGNINFPRDSTLSKFTSKSVSEIDFGNSEYLIFNSLLEQQDNTQIYLLGFVNKSKYNEEKREVSVFIITNAIILVTLIVLGLPLLKLRIMSNAERLGAKDVFWAGVSLVLSPMVLILFFLLFTMNIFTDKHTEEWKLKTLNNRLILNLEKEMTNTLLQLRQAKNCFTPSLSENERISQEFHCKELYDKDGEIDQVIFTDVWDNVLWEPNFRYFNSIFWTDTLGNIKIYLSSERDPPRIGSLAHRKYITNIITGNGIRYKEGTLAFESIRSVSDGNYEIGVGIPSGNAALPVLATSFSSVSLIDPILEEGYGFCLFNKEGQTLFHSEKQRNLNENFLEETGEVFNPYLLSGVDRFTSVRYMGKDHYMYFKKIAELDGYYLATFIDKAYTYSPNAIALNTTAEMQLAYLFIIFLAYLILFLAACSRKKLKQQGFIFYWLRPIVLKKNNNDDPLYFQLFLINILVLTYLVGTSLVFGTYTYSPALIIHSLLITGVVLILINFWMLSRAWSEKKKTSIEAMGRGDFDKTTIVVIITAYGILLLVGKLLILREIFHVKHLWEIALFILLGGIAAWILNRSNWRKYHTLLFYKLYATSLVILFSIIPTVLFFAFNYNMEQEILFKQKAVALKDKKDNWEEVKKNQFYKERKGIRHPTIVPLNEFICHMSYAASLFSDLHGFTPVKDPGCEPTPTRNIGIFSDWYQNARVEFDGYGTSSQGFIGDGNNSADWSFNGREIKFYASDSSTVTAVSLGSFQTLFHDNWWTMVLFFIFLIWMIYSLISFVIQKAFGLDFKAYADKLVLPEDYRTIGQQLTKVYKSGDVKKDSFNNSFIVGINASHIYEIHHSLRDWKQGDFYSIDFLDLPNLMEDFKEGHIYSFEENFASKSLDFQIGIRALLKSSTSRYNPLFRALDNKHLTRGEQPIMVFVEHFEYAYDNELLNRIKLNILQRLVSRPSIRVVVSSEISPTKIYEFYEDSIKKATAISSSGTERSLENSDKINSLKSVYKQWQHLLGGFYRITVPFYLNKSRHMTNELKYGQYLNRINYKYKFLYPHPDETDDYVLNVQETAYTYYYAIWNSLTKEERYIVYDIAQDGFVNTNNVNGIIDLLHKGILVYDHSLRLMNESFTNFVLTKVDSDEALERELEYNKRGNWGTASAVLLLVIVSLIFFISLGKINILEDVNALLGSLAAIFALLFRVSGMFVTGRALKE